MYKINTYMYMYILLIHLFNYRLFYSSFEINCFRYYMENAKTLYVHP